MIYCLFELMQIIVTLLFSYSIESYWGAILITAPTLTGIICYQPSNAHGHIINYITCFFIGGLTAALNICSYSLWWFFISNITTNVLTSVFMFYIDNDDFKPVHITLCAGITTINYALVNYIMLFYF